MTQKLARLYWHKDEDGVNRPVGICTVCKKEFRNGNAFASSYCLECAKRIKREKTRERVRRHRANKKLAISEIKKEG